MTEFICKFCDKKFNSSESLEQHVKAKHETSHEEKTIYKKRKIKRYVLLFVLIIVIAIFSYTFYLKGKQKGQYDEFAKCLSSKGVVVYGNDFCQYTTRQLNFFGKSDKYLNYVKCIKNKELCDSKGVKITPAWEINKEMYEGVQSFERLSELSGCEL